MGGDGSPPRGGLDAGRDAALDAASADARVSHDAGPSDAASASEAEADAEGGPPPDTVIGYTESGATTGVWAKSGDLSMNVGREFHVVETGISVVDLGVWDEGADGLAAAHTVTLFSLNRAGQGAIATAVRGGSITVPVGTAAALHDGFRFASLPAPIRLAMGDYAIVAYGFTTQDPYGDGGNIPLSSTGIIDAQFDPYDRGTTEAPASPSPTFPTGGDGNDHAGASMHYQVVNGKFTRVMPLGDSITDGSFGTTGGYRGPLSTLLDDAGFPHQLVGNASDNAGASLPPDQRHHEGHPGWVIGGESGSTRSGLADSIATWLGPTGVTPDIILLQIGTNDVDTNFDLANAGNRIDALITKISDPNTGLKPGARLIVAQITPINNSAEDAKVRTYNAQIATIVAKHKASGQNVALVDMHAAISVATDMHDKLHPNDVGYAKMAQVWSDAILGK
jgi:lysophospholipase L1-like esterase